MSSMDWPFSSFFSISTISFTPSTTSCTCSTSDEPSRSALEMSNTAPTAAVSTPPAREQTPQRHWTGSRGAGGESEPPIEDRGCSPASRARLRAARCPGWRGR
uniref:Uncharacterized protein n=1 Tax=Mus musculus TaxID=10090 RepID=Q9D1Z4_MOUSE|nr:unnamed protein product [Mus musculus]